MLSPFPRIGDRLQRASAAPISEVAPAVELAIAPAVELGRVAGRVLADLNLARAARISVRETDARP
jgi:hypothetical protein